jgi:hypothetical protein
MVREEFVWQLIKDEADWLVKSEPLMSEFLQRSILDHSSLLEALGHCLAYIIKVFRRCSCNEWRIGSGEMAEMK